MTEVCTPALRIVDGRLLDEKYRRALRPAEWMADRNGGQHQLPEYFYEIESWNVALKTQLTAHFALWEFINVDVHEVAQLRSFPRYVPCAVTLLAACLELLRLDLGTAVHIAANGGYRSPGHALTRDASTHCWASAVNIYRIGDDYLDSRERIETYSARAMRVLPSVWARPFGSALGFADDHLHLDLGYVNAVSRCALISLGRATIL